MNIVLFICHWLSNLLVGCHFCDHQHCQAVGINSVGQQEIRLLML